MALEPYENQLIGAFLYAFGYAAAMQQSKQHRTGHMMPVNLLQQTPLDTAFGDLVVGSDRCLIIEFKRSPNELKSELKKWSKSGFSAFLKNSKMLQLSARTHLVVYGMRQNMTLNLRSCIYLDLLGALQKPSLDRGSGLQLIEILLKKFEAKDARFGASSAELSEYLTYLSDVRKKQTSQGGQQIANGAWVGVAEKDGQLVLQSADSLEMLLGHALDHVHEQDLDIDGPDRGLSL